MKRILIPILVAGSLVSGQAALFQYTLTFSDEGEANASPATGSGTVDYDSLLHTLTLSVTFSGLQGTTTAAHIHSPTTVAFTGSAGVATTTPSLVGFPLGVTSGTYSDTLDLTQASSYNPSYITAHGNTTAQAEQDFAASLEAGTAYWNIHSTFSTGGEIRAFTVPVPEPGTSALAALGILGLAARAWNKRARAVA